MTQLLLESDNKLDLKLFVQIAKRMGISVSYVAQNDKNNKNPMNPSPSGDPWWDNPKNVAEVEAGIRSGIEEGYVPLEDIPGFQEYMKKKKRTVCTA